MSINIEMAVKEFLKYTKNYDLNNENIQRKQKHSLRVMQISEEIAEKLNLNEEEIQLAKLIGLLHDIARFEQYTQYQTFKDLLSFDHGDYALTILDKDIRKYIEVDEFDEIIRKAIKNHNKYKIEEGLTKKEELFAKIIRDADKIDIFYESVEIFWKGMEKQIEESIISEEVLESINNNTTIKRKKEKIFQNIDYVIEKIALIFDLNFKSSFEIMQDKDYINKILNRFNISDEYTKNAVEEVRKIVNSYIERKLEK